MSPDHASYLQPTEFLDWEHEAVQDFFVAAASRGTHSEIDVTRSGTTPTRSAPNPIAIVRAR